jgi:hypothetical protein
MAYDIKTSTPPPSIGDEKTRSAAKTEEKEKNKGILTAPSISPTRTESGEGAAQPRDQEKKEEQKPAQGQQQAGQELKVQEEAPGAGKAEDNLRTKETLDKDAATRMKAQPKAIQLNVGRKAGSDSSKIKQDSLLDSNKLLQLDSNRLNQQRQRNIEKPKQ